MRCDEAQEWITAWVDDELSAEERLAIESHLAQCSECRSQLERETALKGDLRRVSATITTPQALRRQIAVQLSELNVDRPVARKSFNRSWFGLPRLRPAWALAIALMIVAVFAYQWRPGQDIAAVALTTHESIVNGKELLVRAGDSGQLRKNLALAVNNRFAPVALDLSMAKLRPVAGLVKKIGDRRVLVTVYEGDRPTITCYTFLGTEADAPKNAELFRDDEMRVNFYIFSKDQMSAVMHQEGEVICILIAKMAPAELLDLLRGKAHHA
jgi:anti-sigma factor (TIGR02949 family)